MEEMKQILVLIGIGIPTLGAIGLFMIKKIMTLSEKVARLEGIHHESERHELMDK